LQNPDYQLSTTSKNISEFLVVLTRTESVKIQITHAMDILQEFLVGLDIYFQNPKSSQIFYGLLCKYKPSGLRIHDFEIGSIALANNIQYIATFNTSDFKAIKEIELLIP